jgi:tagatose 6-phosphate kinase
MITAVCPNPSVDKIYRLEKVTTGVNRCLDTKSHPGGKGVHVGIALHELGAQTSLLGFWGGPTGKWIRDECEAKGISCLGPEIDTWSRSCITILTSDKFNNSEILETGPAVNDQQLKSFYNAAEIAAASSRAVCVSGSWPDGNFDDAYHKLKVICSQHNADLWVDASGKHLEHALDAAPFGIHLNKQEAADLLGPDYTILEMVQKLHQTVQVVALTDGANGLFLAINNRYYHALCRIDRVISTVGAGDCLTAGILHTYYLNHKPEEIAKMGAVCGAANCLNPDLGMLRTADIELLWDRAVVQEI